MKIFAIKDSNTNNTLAFLYYYEIAKKFYIELYDDADEWSVPLILSSFAKRKKYTVDSFWSKKWVQQRIVPTDRQNLGMILRDNKLKNYDEYKLLLLANGRCAQDDYYIKKISEKDVPKSIKKRAEKRVQDVIPLNNKNILVFFKNGITKKCDLEKMKLDRTFAPIKSNDNIFKKVSVETGGYGICWGENLSISSEILYNMGTTIPLSLDELENFVGRRLVGTTEAASMLNCSRQNIDRLVKDGKLEIVKKVGNNNLFRKCDIEKLSW